MCFRQTQPESRQVLILYRQTSSRYYSSEINYILKMTVLLLLLLLLNVASIAPAMRICNVDECSDRGGGCHRIRCITDDCDDCAEDDVCLGGICEVGSENCGTVDGIENWCLNRAEQCGEGFCAEGSRCVNDACRFELGCNEQDDGNNCSHIIVVGGTCSGGACLISCVEDSDCGGNVCIDGSCAVENGCIEQDDGSSCSQDINVVGTCSDGACLISCVEDRDCRGVPCISGSCADVNCGESYCFIA
ncbi:hypothetical protein SNE40_015780 [Patella caerulea]|uniref:Uncharacterized protein n=1 Tax=Patella caerulea TaxID=87958 RepID=A0AAN8JGE4_PATCE